MELYHPPNKCRFQANTLSSRWEVVSLQLNTQTLQLPVSLLAFSVFLPAWVLKEISYVLQLHAALKHIWGQQKNVPQGGVILHLGDEV